MIARAYIYWTHANSEESSRNFASSKNDLATNMPLLHFNIDDNTERLHNLSNVCDIKNMLTKNQEAFLKWKIQENSKLFGEVWNFK